LPNYADVAEQIAALALSVDPAELHGSLCALRCGDLPRANWLAEAMIDADMALPSSDSPLGRLDALTVAQLASADFGLELLLPEPSEPVEARGIALVAWCRGFLGAAGTRGVGNHGGRQSARGHADCPAPA
jgi:uncharacterized protein YgfB (UPF0149 family)